MSPETGPTGPTEEPTEIRNRESEIKENVEFWKGTKHELSELEVREAIEAVPEVEGYNWYHVIPKGIKNSEIFQMMLERYPSSKNFNLDEITMPENSDETYAVATKFQQEPDADSLGEHTRSAEVWEKTNDQFMNPAVRLVADMRYFQETGKHLDEKNATMSPRSRNEITHVPAVSFSAVNHNVVIVDHFFKHAYPNTGIRKVSSGYHYDQYQRDYEGLLRRGKNIIRGQQRKHQ